MQVVDHSFEIARLCRLLLVAELARPYAVGRLRLSIMYVTKGRS